MALLVQGVAPLEEIENEVTFHLVGAALGVELKRAEGVLKIAGGLGAGWVEGAEAESLAQDEGNTAFLTKEWS